jgi:uncharacterized protein (UPF0333 family)
MRKKGQAAMEYLMTYGWAILIIVVVVAALYAMGVFRTKGTVGCSPCFSYFAYVDHDATTVVLKNGAREIDTVALGNNDATGCTAPAAGTVTAGTEMRFTSCAVADGELMNITYRVIDSGLSKADSATLRGT